MQVLALDFNATDDLGGQVVVTGSNNLIRSQNAYDSIAVSSADPLLGTLANNGGATLTHALLEGSPAIGQGSNLLNLVNDQRGDTYARVVGGTIDIGAFQLQTVATPELPGDYNGSQGVDAADYVIWRKTKGADVPQYSGADGNGSGKIDDADYEVWRGNFGALSSGSSAAAAPQLNPITAEAQLNERHMSLKDLALFEAFAEHSLLRSANSPRHDDYLPLGEQVSRPISQHDRNEALLAITAVQSEPPSSRTTKISAFDDVVSDGACSDTKEFLPPLGAASPVRTVILREP